MISPRSAVCIHLLLAILPAIPFTGTAQQHGQPLLDSLTHEIPKPRHPRDQVVLFYRLGNQYSAINTDSALHYSFLALRLAQKINWTKSICKAYTLTGFSLYNKGDYPNAIRYYDTAIDLSQKAHDTINWNMTLLNIGAVYNVQGNYAKAMQYFVKCLETNQQLNDNHTKALALQNISNIYMQSKDTADALRYSADAYDAYEAAGDRQGMALSLFTSGSVYDGAGRDSLALDCYRKASRIYQEEGDKDGAARTLNSEGSLYLKKMDLPHALATFSSGLELARQVGNKYELAVLQMNLGMAYLQSAPANPRSAANLRSARNYLLRALAINKEEKFDVLKDNYSALSKLDSLAGDYRAALSDFEQYTALKDSIFNTDNRQTIRELEDKRQIEVRDQQIRINQLELASNQLAISRQNTQRWMYIGGIFLLGVIGSLLYRQSHQRKKANTRLQLLNTALDEANQVKSRLFGVLSHDLRSPIANLVSFLNLRHDHPDMLDPDQADRHQQQITLAAGNLLDTMEDLLLWSKEQMRAFNPQPRRIAVTSLFAELDKLYPPTSHWQIGFNTPPQLTIFADENFLKTILRNLTTNAIKAVTSTLPPGLITWTAWEADGKKHLSITDNGPGISPQDQAILQSETASAGAANRLGLHLVRDFAASIGCHISVDSTPGQGSRFTLTFFSLSSIKSIDRFPIHT